MPTRRRYALQLVLTAAGCYAGARVGIELSGLAGGISAVWPPTGIALAAILLGGYRLWPAVLVAALLTVPDSGLGALSAAGAASGAVVEATLGAWLLRRAGFSDRLEGTRDVLSLAALGAIVSPALATTMITTVFVVGGTIEVGEFWHSWWVGWAGDASGVLMLAPLTLTMSRTRLSAGRIPEVALLAAVLAGAGLLSFFSWAQAPYVVFPPLLWAAMRFGTRGAAAAASLVSAITIAATANGNGPFAVANVDHALAITAGFTAVISVTTMVLASAWRERELARAQMELAEARYRLLVEQVPAVTYVDAADSGDPLYISPQLEALVGYSAAEWTHDPELWSKRLHPDDHDRVVAAWSAGRRDGTDHGGDYRLVARDGRIVWVDDRSAPLFETSEGHLLVQGVMLDITERKRVEQMLLATEHRRQSVISQIVRAEEDERARIATELHDDTVQVMTATLLSLDRLVRSIDDGRPATTRAAAETARQTLADATERTRRLMFELRPPLLEQSGLAIAVRELAEQAGEEAGFATTIEARLTRYPRATEDLTYRIVQEAIANARKHSQATLVELVLVERDGAIHGTVSDDGRGFDVAVGLDRSRMRLHLGLDAVGERIRLVNGAFSIRSTPGNGTTVEFTIPIAA